MHQIDKLAQDWVEGRNLSEGANIASKIHVDNHLMIRYLQQGFKEYAFHIMKVHTL